MVAQYFEINFIKVQILKFKILLMSSKHEGMFAL